MYNIFKLKKRLAIEAQQVVRKRAASAQSQQYQKRAKNLAHDIKMRLQARTAEKIVPETGATSHSFANSKAKSKNARSIRKCVDACIARQKHKHFVDDICDIQSKLHKRVVFLQNRKGYTVKNYPHLLRIPLRLN